MATDTGTINWHAWIERWERQQSGFIQFREERFTVMLDLLEAVVGDACTVIDLGCGPGAITRRVVERFPQARVIAVDLDPVLIAIGRHTLGNARDRVTWVEADLGDPGWTAALPLNEVDAALSTTAIHWLSAGRIVGIYRELGRLIRRGGLLLNGDWLDFPTNEPTLRDVSLALRERRRAAAAESGIESWEEWWMALRAEPELANLFAERDRRFDWRNPEREQAIGAAADNRTDYIHPNAIFEMHRAALLDAEFSEVDVVWQYLSARVLAGVR